MSNKGYKIQLKKKLLKNGTHSYYIQYYNQVSRTRHREYLGLYPIVKPKTEIEKSSNKELELLANRVYAKKLLELQEGKFGFISKQHVDISFIAYFEQCAELKKNITSEKNYSVWMSTLKHLKAFTSPNLKLTEINEEHLNRFKQYLQSEKLTKSETTLSQNSASSYFNKVKACLREAYNNKMIVDNPASRVKSIPAGESRREFLTTEEIQLLYKTECHDPKIKRAFLFSVLTGLRFSDVQKLRWCDLQHSEQHGHFIRFQQQKTKNHEMLPVTEQVVSLLGSRSEDEEQRIFKGLKYSAHNNHLLLYWVKNAGINKHITFHSARHTHACLLLSQGVDIYTVSKMLGHKEIKTTQIYLKVMDTSKVHAVSKIPVFEI